MLFKTVNRLIIEIDYAVFVSNSLNTMLIGEVCKYINTRNLHFIVTACHSVCIHYARISFQCAFYQNKYIVLLGGE